MTVSHVANSFYCNLILLKIQLFFVSLSLKKAKGRRNFCQIDLIILQENKRSWKFWAKNFTTNLGCVGHLSRLKMLQSSTGSEEEGVVYNNHDVMVVEHLPCCIFESFSNYPMKTRVMKLTGKNQQDYSPTSIQHKFMTRYENCNHLLRLDKLVSIDHIYVHTFT